MLTTLQNPRIQKVITLPEDNDQNWKKDLQRLEAGDLTLDRKTAGENSIKAIQRLLIFLGYSTASSGSFLIDGDFGRGTNRAVAQFEFEHKLNPKIRRNTLCYECSWSNARKRIVAIPDTRLTLPTLKKMLEVAAQNIENNHVMCGDFDEAIFQLNSLHRRSFYSCRQILERYRQKVEEAVRDLKDKLQITVQPAWLLTIMKQETAGVIRPRFEQHLLTRYNNSEATADFSELRYRSMSFGLGQILGANFPVVGAPTAKAMFVSPVTDQIKYIGRFLASRRKMREAVAKKNPGMTEFRAVARYYNGPKYEAHQYHEGLESWFREFRSIM